MLREKTIFKGKGYKEGEDQDLFLAIVYWPWFVHIAF